MKIARNIKIQKLQTKNRMVGATFNFSGHTSESLDNKAKSINTSLGKMTDQEIIELGDKYKAIEDWKEKDNIFCSNSMEHNLFNTNWGWKYKELKNKNK